MDLLGYVDLWSLAPGETIRLRVSSKQPRFRADIVRLIHGDRNPRGPGHREERVESALSGDYPGQAKTLPAGSFVAVPDAPHLRLSRAFTLAAWIFPTTPAKGEAQGIVTKWDHGSGVGAGLFVGAEGDLELWLGDGETQAFVNTGASLRAHEWTFVGAAIDGSRALLVQRPVKTWIGDPANVSCEFDDLPRAGITPGPIVVAGRAGASQGVEPPAASLYNGKIEAPLVLGGVAGSALDRLARGTDPNTLGLSVLGAWDFALEPSSSIAFDRSRYGHHGVIINLPMRLVTGRRWTGTGRAPSEVPHEYAAIWFHEDDLEDARWSVDLEWTVPEGTRSGAYAFRLEAGGETDEVPFFVRPPYGAATAEIAFLAPTLSYLAYGNEHSALSFPDFARLFSGVEDVWDRVSMADRFVDDHRLLSIYDPHSDGSGNAYSSRLRPVLTMRPGYRMPLIDAPHQFAADLYLIDWLEHEGLPYDVLTDDDLHAEGLSLLAPYRVLLTGSHPEYWTASMLAALEEYLDAGGRLMYLGANGLYWVTSIDPGRPHVIEVRRGFGGSRGWESRPGEAHHSSTGELGGLWRHRHQAPQAYTGVGFTAQGGGPGRTYKRTAASRDERVRFIFEGLEDEPIGEDGLILGGAAAYEIDRADAALGTPPHAIVLATATGFTDHYQGAVEDVLQSDSKQAGSVSELVRADVVFFETAAGGAVFSTGSVAWTSALSARGYTNPVAQITRNVLKRFLDAERFVGPGEGRSGMPATRRVCPAGARAGSVSVARTSL